MEYPQRDRGKVVIMGTVNRITPFVSAEGDHMPGEDDFPVRDVPYYTISVTVLMGRTGDWSDHAEGKPEEVRTIQMSIPKDQLPGFENWKHPLANLVSAAAASACLAELKNHEPPKPLTIGPISGGPN